MYPTSISLEERGHGSFKIRNRTRVLLQFDPCREALMTGQIPSDTSGTLYRHDFVHSDLNVVLGPESGRIPFNTL